MSDGINDGHAYFEGAPIASERPADPAGEAKKTYEVNLATMKHNEEVLIKAYEAQLLANQAENATLRAQVARLAEATRLVDFYRDTHGCEDSDICTGCAAATLFLKQTRAQATPPSPAPDAVREKGEEC